MEQHYKLTDIAFEEAFKNCTLAPAIFTHEAHLRLAWIHITKYGRDIAIENVCNQLKVFTEFIGTKEKYNATLTVAAINAVSHFIEKSQSLTFRDLIDEFPRLRYNFKALMNFHYSIDIFDSAKAKKVYIKPDLVPFDHY